MKNNKKNNKLKKINLELIAVLNTEFSKMALRCKFNFSYLDINQGDTVSFGDLNEEKLKKLINQITSFSKESILYWKQCKRFVNYGEFPQSSKLNKPSFVPSGVEWSRFRLEGGFRLAGFTVPHEITKAHVDLDTNTFYVVFLDPDHKFYSSESK